LEKVHSWPQANLEDWPESATILAQNGVFRKIPRHGGRLQCLYGSWNTTNARKNSM